MGGSRFIDGDENRDGESEDQPQPTLPVEDETALAPSEGCPGVEIMYRRAAVGEVRGAAAIDTLTVYYVSRDGRRGYCIGLPAEETRLVRFLPVKIHYDPYNDKTVVHVVGGSLVHLVAERDGCWAAESNPKSEWTLDDLAATR